MSVSIHFTPPAMGAGKAVVRKNRTTAAADTCFLAALRLRRLLASHHYHPGPVEQENGTTYLFVDGPACRLRLTLEEMEG